MSEPMRLYQAPSTEIRGRPRLLSAAPTTPTAPAPADDKPPTWAEITGSPRWQTLSGDDKEKVRLGYWRDVVSPMVPTEELEEALSHFERRTGGQLKAVRAGPPPTDTEIENASKPARMVVTKQGQPMFGRQAEGSIGAIRQMQRHSPVLKRYTDHEVAAIVGAGLNAQKIDQAGGRLHSDDEAPISMP